MSNNNTVVKTFRILDLISKSATHLTGSEISKELGLPASTTHDILKTLLDENVIYYKDFNRKTYAIGVRIFALSKGYIYDSNIINISSSYIIEICDKYGICGFVLKPVYKSMLVTYKYESEKSIVKVPDVGYEFNRTIHKEKGVYMGVSDIHEQLYTMAVPIYDYTENAIGEIKLIGLKETIEQNKEEIEKQLLEYASNISVNLGETRK